MTEPKGRHRMPDLPIAAINGLKGFRRPYHRFPGTLTQTCIAHLIRYSIQFVPWKERR